MKTLQDAIKRIKELQIIVIAFEQLKKDHETLKANHETLKANHETLKADHETLKADHENTKKEVKDLWSYMEKLEKHFESCWNGLRAIFDRDHRPYKTAQKAMLDSKAEFPEVFTRINETD